MTGSWVGTRSGSPRMFADLAGIVAGQRVLDVGCGPGALTSELVRRLGPAAVAAVDPSDPSSPPRRPAIPASRCNQPSRSSSPSRTTSSTPRWPSSSSTSWPIRSMGSVRWLVSPGPAASSPRASGTTAGATAHSPCSGARPASSSPASMMSRRWPAPGRAISRSCSLTPGYALSRRSALWVSVEQRSFDDWWEPFTLGVGPAGAHVAGLEPSARDQLRELCRRTVPAAPFVVDARCWAARGVV